MKIRLLYSLILFTAHAYGRVTQPEDCRQSVYQLFGTRPQRIAHVLFVPDTNVKTLLVGLIQNERESIYGALFRLSDKDVVQALCDAHRRGVKIKLVVDCSGLQDRYEKISLLVKSGIDVHQYKVPTSTLHHKFFIFGNNNYYGPIVWTGSANATQSGLLKNQENVHLINETALINGYRKKFDELYKTSVPVRAIQVNFLIS